MTSDSDQPLRIAFWGLPGSGKTCLARSIMHSLAKFPQTRMGMVSERLPTNSDSGYPLWLVGRKPVNYPIDEQVEISIMLHRVEVFDPQEIEPSSIMQNRSAYTDANIIFITLDPIALSDFEHPIQLETPYPQGTDANLDKHEADEDEIDLDEFVQRSIFFQQPYKEYQRIPMPKSDPLAFTLKSVQPDHFIGNVNAVPLGRISRQEYADQVVEFLRSVNHPELKLVVFITKRDKLPEAEWQASPQTMLHTRFGSVMVNALAQNYPDYKLFATPPGVSGNNPPKETDAALGFDLTPEELEPLISLLEKSKLNSLHKESTIYKNSNLKKYIPYFEVNN